MDTKAFDDFLIQNMPDSIKTRHQAGMNFVPSTAIVHSGFIAQEVQQAATESGFTTDIVHAPADANDNYSIAYGAMVVPLVKAVQELSKTVDSLKTALSTCCQASGSGNRMMQNGNEGQDNSDLPAEKAGSTLQINLENNNQAILYQNEPNPFDGSTVIRYFLPQNVTGNTFVVFYDMYGKEVNKLEIQEKGFGKIEANTENLASGVYSYSIIVNGTSIDTKKMLKSK